MAPAAVLLCSTGAGALQSLCQNNNNNTASSSNVWQAKRSVSSGSALNRPSAESKVEAASVKSSLPASVYESRRRVDLRHVVRSGPSRRVFTAAVEGNVATEEPSTESVVAEESSVEKASEAAAFPEEGSAPATAPQRKFRSRRGNPRAKREEPTVPLEALVPGAVFTGKVTTIQPFGAFVNFGAFTDGLVHISKLSSGYASNVSDIVSVGQEVQVTVLDVDNGAGRIALSMVDKEEKEGSGRQGSQEGNGGRSVNKGKIAGRGNQANRRDDPKKPPTKLAKGQAVEGTVKNSARGGVYVLLPEEEEGFLKYTEIPGGENMAPEASLQVGQKVSATVLRIDRGRVLLSMKPVVDLQNVNSTINKGADGSATNPFEIAFRAMDLVPEKDEAAEESVEEESPVAETQESSSATLVDAEEECKDVKPVEAEVIEVPPVVEDPTPPGQNERDVIQVPPPDAYPEAAVAETVEEKVEEVTEAAAAEVATETPVEEKVEEVAEFPVPEAAAPALVEETAEEVAESPDTEAAAPALVEETAEEVAESPDTEAAAPALVEETAEEVAESPGTEAAAPALIEETAEVTVSPPVEAAAPAAVEEKAGDVKEATAAEPTTPPPEPATQAPVAAPAAVEKKGGITAAVVKQLRDETGAGMMDCKRALADSNGDLEKAREFLRKKGLASAEKKASRIAAEGLIGSYIHDSRIGVLIEVNCETDFVARGPAFKELVADLGMQVVACPQVKYVSAEDIPADFIRKETEMEMQREDLASKPEAVRARIVEGRVSKRMNEFVLLEQPYIRNDSILVKDLIKQTISTLGENIKVRRFERYNLGEGLEKRNEDFAAEVAAQTKTS